ncbi:creatininase family protein [Streptomyces scopuliridis]|uniref:creatininase family protein n=1 Tax=Streptomyces scopuliridis TaxID=452529 RepID=UPI0036BCD12F
MTTEEAATAVTAGPVVIIPAGAFEQHGPAMPLATDTIRAEGVAERVAAALAGRAVIGPPLPFSSSGRCNTPVQGVSWTSRSARTGSRRGASR